MDLTKDQKLLLLSAGPGSSVVEMHSPAPDWLVEECVRLGLVERIGRTSAWRLTPAGVEVRRELLGE